jgi:hypothetical protein
VIALNPLALSNNPAKVAYWIVQHECGQHELPQAQNSEVKADCMVSRKMKATY